MVKKGGKVEKKVKSRKNILQNGENYYKMNIVSVKNKLPLRIFIPNVWWFLVFTLVFTCVVFLTINKTENISSISSYPAFTTIAIDAGHGGIDGGATGNGLIEADINLQISEALQETLSSLSFQTVMTRTGDYGLYGTTLPGFKKRDMLARKEICESGGADILVSIHLNASILTDRTGVVIYCDTKNAQSLEIANAIASQLENAVVRHGDFFITTKINMPAVLIECGFITTASEAEKLATAEYRQEIADDIAKGILKYQLGI